MMNAGRRFFFGCFRVSTFQGFFFIFDVSITCNHEKDLRNYFREYFFCPNVPFHFYSVHFYVTGNVMNRDKDLIGRLGLSRLTKKEQWAQTVFYIFSLITYTPVMVFRLGLFVRKLSR